MASEKYKSTSDLTNVDLNFNNGPHVIWDRPDLNGDSGGDADDVSDDLSRSSNR